MSTDYPLYGEPPLPEVFLSQRLSKDAAAAESLVRDVRARLDESESLECVLAVCKMSPGLDLLVVTDRRVVAGWHGDLRKPDQPWPVQIPLDAIRDIRVTGFMDNVKFLLAGGGEVKVGNLWEGSDEEQLRAAVTRRR